MIKSRVRARWWTLAGSILAAQAAAAQASPAAFFYASNPPLEALAAFGQIVLQPEAVTKDEVEWVQRGGCAAFAYLSIGELLPGEGWAREARPEWRLGQNTAWGTWVMDPSRREWRELLLRRAQALRAKGFAGLFLDTLDSPLANATDPAARRVREDALVSLLAELKQRDANVRLLLNRGFELLPRLSTLAAGVVAESLFRTFDPATRRYSAASEDGTRWLLARLREAHDRYGLPVVVIDYVPPGDVELARETAKRIASLGFVPWVAQPELDTLGVGLLELVPRRVLLVYDGAEAPDLATSNAYRFAALPLEALGYVVEPHDARQPLPAGQLQGRYAGIVTLMTDDQTPSPQYRSWLLGRLASGMRIAILGHLGLAADPELLAALGLTKVPLQPDRGLRLVHQEPPMGFESPVRVRTQDLQPWRASGAGAVPLLSVEDGNGVRVDPVVLTRFGALALDPYLTDLEYDELRSWMLDPIELLRRVFQRDGPLPALDVTTENGLRLFTFHIDGDGFASRAEFSSAPLAGQVMLDRVLHKRLLPTSVSLIEGEIFPAGHPRDAAERAAIARRIFALPHVEEASHTYSHPFDWNPPRPGLSIPGYRFDLRREIAGSVAHLGALGPQGKSVRSFFWSGEALPQEDALAQVAALGLQNINGGDSRITYDQPSLTDLSPNGRPVGAQYQVYAPIANENSYTHLWTGPFDGYRRAIETFELTDSPRRLKPVSVYVHFYSASKRSSLRALDEVLDWAQAQPLLPLPVSAFAERAQEFQNALLFRTLEGRLLLRRVAALRTLRLPVEMGFPDLARSPGVAALRDLPQGRYVTFAQRGPFDLILTSAPPGLHLAAANGEIVESSRTATGLILRVKGWTPVELLLEGPGAARCRVLHGPVARRFPQGSTSLRLKFAASDTGLLDLACPGP